MKAIAINGSPRKDKNTARLLKEALRGAQSAGASAEIIHLYDLNYRGCISCFGCKTKGADLCRCYMRDELTPILEKVLDSDVLLLGSPIYFGEVTGQMRSFLERLAFITLSYDDIGKTIFKGHINSAFFYTMNVPDADGYKSMMENNMTALQRLGGTTEYYSCTDTLQFDDYLKYCAAAFDEQKKREHQEVQFPKDLETAFRIGNRLSKQSKK